MATSRKSDLQRQLRELDEARARLIAEIKDEEDDLVNEGINLPDGTRDGDDDGKDDAVAATAAKVLGPLVALATREDLKKRDDDNREDVDVSLRGTGDLVPPRV